MSGLADKRKFYINGQWVDPVVARDLEVIDPSTEEAVALALDDAAAEAKYGQLNKKLPYLRFARDPKRA